MVRKPGPPEVLRVEEAEKPEPGVGEVLISVSLAGVNYADAGMWSGVMGGPHPMDLPYTPGFEVARTVAGIGEGVRGLEGGERVAAVLGSGGYAEHVVAAADSVVTLPAPAAPRRPGKDLCLPPGR